MLWYLDFDQILFWEMDIKAWYLILAFCFGITSFVIYFIDLVKGPTHAHPVSWLIWLLTASVGVGAAQEGGGGYGMAYAYFYCFCILSIFIYSLYKDGFSRVDREDLICLGICLVGIATWIAYNTPLVALILSIGIDAYGFRPTFKKVYREPWSESVWGWGLSIPNVILTTMAMNKYNWWNIPYPASMVICAALLVGRCLQRRRYVPKPA